MSPVRSRIDSSPSCYTTTLWALAPIILLRDAFGLFGLSIGSLAIVLIFRDSVVLLGELSQFSGLISFVYYRTTTDGGSFTTRGFFS